MAPLPYWNIRNNEWDRMAKCHYTKKSSLDRKSSLQNKIHDIINPRYLKKERGKYLKFPQEWHKDESIKTDSPAIHLNGRARHFEHEYIIKLSLPTSIEFNAEFRSRVSLRQTQAISRHKQGSQQGFLSIMCPFSTLTEIIYHNPQ